MILFTNNLFFLSKKILINEGDYGQIRGFIMKIINQLGDEDK